VPAEHEVYFSITDSTHFRAPTMTLTHHGGMDIEELDRSQWGLVEARVDSYKGLVFATWDKQAPALADYLGDAAWYLGSIAGPEGGWDRNPGGCPQMGNKFQLEVWRR